MKPNTMLLAGLCSRGGIRMIVLTGRGSEQTAMLETAVEQGYRAVTELT